MRMIKTGLLAAAMILAAASARADAVDDALAAEGFKVVACRTHDVAQEKADFDLAQAALEKLNARDIASVDAMMGNLRAALARAPDTPALPERCGNEIDIYSDDLFSLLHVTAILSKSPALAGLSAVQKGALPYGHIAFVVGWVEYEHKDYEAAVVDYARGLKSDPDNVSLASEYASTLSALGRPEDALAFATEFLTAHPGLPAPDRATMLRRRGYALVDLARWDEAEAAYSESLKLEPGNEVAKNDLQYIAENRNKH